MSDARINLINYSTNAAGALADVVMYLFNAMNARTCCCMGDFGWCGKGLRILL